MRVHEICRIYRSLLDHFQLEFPDFDGFSREKTENRELMI